MEAITRKKEVDEMKTLTKEIGFIIANNDGGFTLTPTTQEGWEQPNAGQGFFINRTYFDLAGLSMDDKTLFFEGAAIQEVLAPATSPSTVGNGIVVVDVMSNKQLTDAECAGVLAQGNLVGPGNLTFDQTIYMRHRIFNTDIDNAAGGYMIPIADNQLGSLSATASDRVYCTRIVSMAGADGLYQVYGVRYLIKATAKEEPEYEYLMRLKRSYDLQNEPDRD